MTSSLPSIVPHAFTASVLTCRNLNSRDYALQQQQQQLQQQATPLLSLNDIYGRVSHGQYSPFEMSLQQGLVQGKTTKHRQSREIVPFRMTTATDPLSEDLPLPLTANNSNSNNNSNNNSNSNSKNNHNSNNTRNSSNSHHTHPPTRHPSVAIARLTGLVHTTIWPEHAGLTESIGQITLKSFRLSEQRGVRKVCLLWSKEPLDVGGRPIFITPLPRGVKEQSVCDLETLPGTSFVW